jgi:hypothetical protein
MTTAAYKDLCIDAVDAHRLGRFWAAALGLDLGPEPDDGRAADLSGPTPRHRVWMNPVPEAKTVKHRMHLDVHAASVDEHVALGATVLDADSFRWTVMADPEGGEYCLFVRDEPPAYRLDELVVDAVDAPAIAGWWAGMLGARIEHDDEGFPGLVDIPGAPFEAVVFAPVPEPKSVKNRIHVDVTTDDLDGLVASGARLLRPRDDEIAWNVMADPEGNEFCAFVV